MGDRYTLKLDCATCGATNENVWYAPSCEVTTFICDQCKQKNKIEQGFHAVKMG